MAVLADNRQTAVEIRLESIEQKAKTILNALASEEKELSVTIVDDQEMTTLNREYRNRNSPTNVLSFSMQEGEFPTVSPDLLGDVVISAETALREAEENSITLDQRLTQLLVHGILHLLGYDHEQGETEAARMEEISRKIVRMVENNTDLAAF